MPTPVVISPGVYNTGTVTSVADTTNTAAASATKICAEVAWFGSASLSSVSGGGLTWQIDKSNGGTSNRVAIASADAPSGLASGTTITATFSTFVDVPSIRLIAVDGLASNSAGAVDGSGGANNAASTTNWSVSLTTSNATDFLLAFDWCDFYTGGMAATSPAVEIFDWTTVDGSELQTVYKTVTSSGSQTVGGTFTGARTNAAVAVAYKQVTAANIPIDPAVLSLSGQSVTVYGGDVNIPTGGWWDAVDAAAAGTGRARYIVVGDSFVQGTGSSSRANTFTAKIAPAIRTLHSIAGSGTGLVSFEDANSHTGTVTVDDTETQAGGGHFTGSASATWNITGTAFDVVYRQTPGAAVITVKVDGSTVGTITHPGSGSNDPSHIQSFTGLSSGAHTVQLVTTDTQYIDGIIPYNGDSASVGVSFIKCGRSGTQTEFWVTTNPNARAGWDQFDPDLVIVEPVINDCWNNVALATSVANIVAQVNYALALPSSPSVLFIAPFFTNFATFFDDGTSSVNSLGLNLDDYRDAALVAVRAIDGAMALDLRNAIPDPVGSSFLDAGHPNDAGHQAYANAIAAFLDASEPPTNQTATVGSAAVTLAGQTPTAAGTGTATIAIDPAILSLSGQTPTATGTGTSAQAVTSAAVTLTGVEVSASAGAGGPITVTVDTATLSLGGQTPTAGGTGTATTTADPGVLTLVGQTPSLDSLTVIPIDTATLSLSGITGALTALGTATIPVDAATLTLTGQTSTLTGVGTVTRAIDTAALALAGVNVSVFVGTIPVLPTSGVILTLGVGPRRGADLDAGPDRTITLDAGPRRGLE